MKPFASFRPAPLTSPFAPGSRLISAAQQIWVAGPDDVTALSECLTGGCTNEYVGKLLIPGVQAGTFDGNNIWFSRNNGNLVKVSPPVATSATTYTPPAVLGRYNVASAALGTVLFDGRYLWTYSGANLIQFDPTGGQAVNTFHQSTTITSLFF